MEFQVADCSLTRFIMDEKSQKAALMLTAATRALLQNTKADLSEQLINLNIDPSNVSEFIQNEAFLRGQLAMVDYLLSSSDPQQQQTKE